MKTLYLDLGMGAAGDMLAAALLELHEDPAAFMETLNGVGIPGVCCRAETSRKCGITGTHFTVTVNGEEEEEPHPHADHAHADHAHGDHHHGSMDEIAHIVLDHLKLSEKVKNDVLAVYGLLAEAESAVHGVPIADVHFHEVGTMDALADITAVCMLMEALAPEQVAASPVHVGAGQVRCAHGLLPVPAPAAALLLRDIPVYGGAIKSELCTPTGAALLKYFVRTFGDMPVLRVDKIGYGMGKKDFEAANCVRAVLGETADGTDLVFELSCNVDDMTAEELGFAAESILAAGAREVFTVPVGMKKNRPGTLVCVLCDAEKKKHIVRALFQYTTTLGVREKETSRYVLDREIVTFETAYGPVRVKRAHGCGVVREKIEYDDLARIAREKGIGLHDARALVEAEMNR